MIALYGMSSPNVEKVVILLEEQALPYQLHHVDLFGDPGGHAEIRSLSPLGKLPILIDGEPRFESGAILLYLAERYGGFLPAGAARYDVVQWLMVQMAAVGPGLGQYTHFSLLGDQADPYAHARFRTNARKIYVMLDKRLTGREWIAASEYSIADIAVLPWSRYLERHGFDAAGFPALCAWRARLDARPAVRRAAARMQDEMLAADRKAMKGASDAQLDRFFGRDSDAPAADFSIVRRL